MPAPTIEEGASYELSHALREGDLASDLPLAAGDAFPPVFATSRMIALMEVAAARLMKPIVPADRLSVGVSLNVTHLTATPGGETVRALATFLGMEGKLCKFRVEVHDRGGKVGEGTHTRAVVETARLLKGSGERIAKGNGGA
jgi:fluoroacetyl-CoA thioesterase